MTEPPPSPGQTLAELAHLTAAKARAIRPDHLAEVEARLAELAPRVDAIPLLAVAAEGAQLMRLADDLAETESERDALLSLGNYNEIRLLNPRVAELRRRAEAIVRRVDLRLGGAFA